MLSSYEKKLYEHWKTLDWDSYYKESLNYDFNTFSEEFNSLIRDDILDKAFENIEEDNTPYEEAIEKWFNSLSKEDREAFLNEDWIELDG